MTPDVLVVDDDVTICATVAEFLSLEGYRVTTAVNGAEALKAVELHRPKLVLLDMRMPVLDGWGFARALGARGIKLPIIVMTAERDARACSEDVGAAGYLGKPFDLDDILTCVEQIVEVPSRAGHLPSP